MRKPPSKLSDQAREQLELSFRKNLYPTKSQIVNLEKQLGLSKKVVQNWLFVKRKEIRRKEGQIHINHYFYC